MPRRSPSRLSLTALEDRWTPTAAGTLDQTFGTSGVAVISPPGSSPGVDTGGVLVLSDGSVVVAAASRPTGPLDSNHILLYRYTAAGKLDPSYPAVPPASGAVASVLDRSFPAAATPDGGFIALSRVENGTLVIRVAADGRVDPTFGTDGIVTVDAGGGAGLSAATVLPDGRIVLAGGREVSTVSNNSGPLVAVRLTAVGRLDPTFGTGGIARVSVPVGAFDAATATAVAVLPDGRVAVAGGAVARSAANPSAPSYPGVSYDPVVVRLTAAGQPDTGFGSNGVVRIDTPATSDEATAVQLLPDGRVVATRPTVVDLSTSATTAFRLTAAGQTDPTYGSNGEAMLPGGQPAILADGRVVVVDNGRLRLRRLTTDGQPDAGFSTDPLPGISLDPYRTPALRPDGTAVMIGYKIVGGRASSQPVLVQVVGTTTAFPLGAGSASVGGSADGSLLTLSQGDSGLALGTAVSVYPTFTGTVRTATADVTGDGVPDLIAGTGPGQVTGVTILDGATGEWGASFQPFESGFTGGVFVTAADLNGDGKAEVVVTPDQGGGPVVAVYDGAGLTAGRNEGASLARFLGIEDSDFRGGARAAAGDVDGDGRPDLVVAAGFGGGPRVAVYDGRQVLASAGLVPRRLVADFFVFEPSLRNGVYVTAADLTGDGAAEVVVGGGPGGGPRVFALDGKGLVAGRRTPVADFFAGDPQSRGGVRLAATTDAGGRPQLVAGSGAGEAASVRVYPPAAARAGAAPTQTLSPFGGAALTDGVYVG